MAYLFGKHVEADPLTGAGPLTPEGALAVVRDARKAAERLRKVEVSAIVDVLDAVGKLWQTGGAFYRRAVKELPGEIAFSPEMIEQTLAIVPLLFRRDVIHQRLRAELDDEAMLDQFRSRPAFAGAVKAVPLGVLLHVSAGNVFIGCIDSLLMGFITKNVSVVKLSSRNRLFPAIFADSIRTADPEDLIANAFAMVHWEGGDKPVEKVFKEHADGIVAWGGEAMVKAYRDGLAPGVKLIDYGPKLSFQVVTKAGAATAALDDVATRIARDVCLWDQAACASPQNLFIEQGVATPALLDGIGKALDAFPVPRGAIDDDEAVEILKEKFRGKLTRLTEGGDERSGRDWYLHVDPHPGLRPSPLNRTLLIKSFKDADDLASQVLPFKTYLQSCGYLVGDAEKEPMLAQLAACGIQRFAKLGSMMESLPGAPHDGRYPLAELVRLVPDEAREDLLAFVNDAIRTVPFYRKLYDGERVASLKELRPITGDDLAKEPLTTSHALLREGPRAGRLFSSGGTSGAPKYTFFAPDEFKAVGDMLAKGFKAQGLKPGDLCANLFVAGNMWSSFMAVDEALTACGAVTLPIGGMAGPAQILTWLQDFRPRFVFGLPSMLVGFAHAAKKAGLSLEIPFIGYAGEHLNQSARALLADAWKTERCFSAGYASVDAGPIGYQCRFCKDREHHLFEEQVHLAIIDDEGVVTSRVRRMMPVIHYKTGDHLEWSPVGEPCGCGSTDRRFVLHGRRDGQINVWSCRLMLRDVEHALADAGVFAAVFQVAIDEAVVDGAPDDTLTVTVEGATVTEDTLAAVTKALFARSKDLATTHGASYLTGRLRLTTVANGAIPRVERTGKVRPLVDKRRL